MPQGPQPKHTVFANRLTIARTRRGLRQIDLGHACGITAKGQMCKIEGGRLEPCLVHLTAIARTLDVSVDWLLGISDKGGV